MYQKYIANLKLTYSTAFGYCKPVCQEMNKVFPELKLVRGHYYDASWGERMHWWLVDPDGNIIDPTAIQFPSKGKGVYIPWDESQPEPTGKCRQCGEYTYNGQNIHDACFSAYLEYNNISRC